MLYNLNTFLALLWQNSRDMKVLKRLIQLNKYSLSLSQFIKYYLSNQYTKLEKHIFLVPRRIAVLYHMHNNHYTK